MSYLGYLERLPAAIVIAGEVAMVPIVVTIVTVVSDRHAHHASRARAPESGSR